MNDIKEEGAEAQEPDPVLYGHPGSLMRLVQSKALGFVHSEEGKAPLPLSLFWQVAEVV